MWFIKFDRGLKRRAFALTTNLYKYFLPDVYCRIGIIISRFLFFLIVHDNLFFRYYLVFCVYEV
ncbi:hypothetical protein GM3709_2732 [Geminocystis sp. NIES-3709]|nr:hypothetical protein GM3709_2732 [Geminocystis sp. NIES-3709]